MGKQKKNSNNTIYLNRPIQNEDEDWIGISTYVDKLDAAVDADARIVAVTSDFGTGKSSLISLYKKRVEHPLCACFGFGKKVLSINMWGTYAQQEEIPADKQGDWGHEKEVMPTELHKAFIYQLVSRINPHDRRKSHYISRRLSKDFGIWAVNGKNAMWSFLAMCSLVGFFLSGLLYKFQKYIQAFLQLKNETFFMLTIVVCIVSLACFVLAVTDSEIIFSSTKSEGKRTLDENILIDLFKQEVLNHRGRQHYIVVIEDLDRIDDKQSVLQFLRELRKYYLTDGGRHKITFVVCIKPEVMLVDGREEQIPEYKKIFDYVINLQKINIENYDTILKGLLSEKKDWLASLDLQAEIETPGMDWMMHGRNIDIREIKSRLNESLTLYESLLNRFPGRAGDEVITFEKCAVATYLRREYENDFYLLEDNTLDVLVSQYGMRGMEVMEEENQPEQWEQFSERFKYEIEKLIKSKLVDANYRLYFYNYPANSILFSLAEMRVYNSIVYQEAPKNSEEYEEYLERTSEKVIQDAYKKVGSLGVRIPSFILDYDKLFVLLCENAKDKIYEMIASLHFDEQNEARACETIEKCIRPRKGDYDRDGLIYEISNQLNENVEDKNILWTIRKRMCQTIPDKVRLYRCLFVGDNPFWSKEEVEAIDDISNIFAVTNLDALDQDDESPESIHRRIIKQKDWKPEYIEFYQQVIARQGIEQWFEALAQACQCFGSIPEQMVAVYKQQIASGKLEIADYVSCMEQVKELGKTQLLLLRDYLWVNGLSERLCQLLYENGFYLEYVCNYLLQEDAKIDYEDQNVYGTIQWNAEWIQAHANTVFMRIRKEVLCESELLEKYIFLYEAPYAMPDKDELALVDDMADALKLLQNRILTEVQAKYVSEYFNAKYRNPAIAYDIMQFIVGQTAEIAHEMFYQLHLEKVAYKKMRRDRRKAMNRKLYEIFEMEDNAEEKVQFLHFTETPIEYIEKNLWQDLNQDENLRKLYVEYVNCLHQIPGYTLNNIVKLNTVYIYSNVIISRLWNNRYYKLYVVSKTMREKQFTMERDKLELLWKVYVEIFHTRDGWSQTKIYMRENQEFLHRLVEQKEYEFLDEEDIVMYADAKQTVALMDYVTSYDNATQVAYFRKIKGFEGKDAAHHFCEIARDNKAIGRDDAVYKNVSGTLVNPGYEGWLTRIWKGKK